VDQLVSNARTDVQLSAQQPKRALTEFMQMKLNALSDTGYINVTENCIQLMVDPAISLSLVNFLSGGTVSPSITMDYASYDFDSSMLTLITRGYGSQTVIPDTLQLQDTFLSLRVNLQNASTLEIVYTGDWVIDATTISLQVVYHRQSGNVSFSAQVSSFSINLQNIANSIAGITLPSALSGSVSISNFVVSGSVTFSLGIRLYVTATSGSTAVYIIYQKDANSLSKKAVAVEMSNIRFSSILEDTTGLDITQIPYFGSISVNIGLSIATTRINDLPSNFFTTGSLLSKMGNRIRENVTAIIRFGFSPIAIKFCYCSGLSLFQPEIPGGISINDLLSAIPNVDIGSIPLPPGIGSFPQLRIETFALDLQLGTIMVNINYPNSLNFFDSILRINNPIPTFTISNLGVKLNIIGNLTISGIDLRTSISLDTALNKYCLTAEVGALPISSLISQMNLELLPPELNSLTRTLPFFSFSIRDASLRYCFPTSLLQIQLGGTPVISGYSTVHMASVIIRQGRKTLLAQGFELGSVNLASILTQITGFNYNNIAILNQNLEVALLISPVTLPNVQLIGDTLSEFSITKGLTVEAIMQFPPSCSSDTFCAVAQSLLGENAQLNLQGTISSTISYTLFAGVSNINLGGGIIMSEAGYEIHGGTNNRVGIVGVVDLSDPDITLAARVFLSTSGVVLEMTMSGCWENAFGANWLDICSIQASVAMIPGLTLTGLALGGEVHIGDESCGTPIVATGFVGIDAITPTNNYYYVNIQGSTTVGTILDAFCININVPAPLAQSGFPRGFISSFSLAGVELPHVPLSIPQGYRLNGTLNILGLEASADVTIGLPSGIDFAVTLPPINVGGLLRMSVSSSDQSQGPLLNAVITLLPTPNVNIEARGYLSVLGINLETTLIVTNTQYIFSIQGRMLNLFEANLHIAASYGNIQRATFQVQGSFTNTLYDTLENLIKNTLSSAGDTASSHLEAAQGELNRVRGVLNGAQSALSTGQDKINDAQSAFDSAVAEVNRLQNEVNSICSTRSCGTGEDYYKLV
jgi:hypothetical protein